MFNRKLKAEIANLNSTIKKKDARIVELEALLSKAQIDNSALSASEDNLRTICNAQKTVIAEISEVVEGLNPNIRLNAIAEIKGIISTLDCQN